MILIIAEKPSVMKNIIDAKLEEFKPKSSKGYQLGKNFIYTHCIGHLLTLKMPGDIDEKYKSWSLDYLPFDFDEIPLEVNKSVSEQFNIVKNLMTRNDIDEIVNACDSDREGDLIFRNLYHFVGKKIPKVTRMWLESQTAEGIKEAYDNRLSEAMYNNVFFAGKARSYADYIIGLNSTRAMTVKYGGNNNMLTIGRVQTPTLRMICDLENEIANFKEEPYYKIKANGTVSGSELSAYYVDDNLDNNKFYKIEEANKIVDAIKGSDGVVTNVETSKKEEKPKMLYSLSDLQIDMDRRYKLSAMDVLNTCQRLYEVHKLITYPRTDENHISKELSLKTYSILRQLSVNTDIRDKILNEGRKINPMMIAKKDIGAHEALTPTTFKASKEVLDKLSQTEYKVYMAIVERFMAAFLDNAIIEKQKIEFNIKDAKFQTEIEICTSLGHREAYKYGKKAGEVKSFLRVKKDDVVNIKEVFVENLKTTPPARFTEGSLIKMMKNPSKYVDNKEDKDLLKKIEGIGTEATRAQIISDLIKHKFIELDKKKNIIATPTGMELIKILPSEDLKSVSLTANFERKLDMVSKGEYDHKVFLDEVKELENKVIDNIKSSNQTTRLNGFVCKCPVCGSDIIEKEKVYACKNQDCKVFIMKNALGAKRITLKQAASMITEGNSKTKVLCLSKKTGHDFEAVMKYRFDNTKEYPNILEFDFNMDAPSEEETETLREEIKPLCKCPNCQSNIIEDNFKYYCSNSECKVLIYKNIRGVKKTTKTLVKELLTKGISKDKVNIVINDKESEAYVKYVYDNTSDYPNKITFIYNKP